MTMMSCLEWLLDNPHSPGYIYGHIFVPGAQERVDAIQARLVLDLESDTRDVQIWLQINRFGGFMDAFKY
jgi:hypothetical protein